jgi:hypothetical protein
MAKVTGLFHLAAATPNQASSRSAWMRERGGGPTRSRHPNHPLWRGGTPPQYVVEGGRQSRERKQGAAPASCHAGSPPAEEGPATSRPPLAQSSAATAFATKQERTIEAAAEQGTTHRANSMSSPD